MIKQTQRLRGGRLNFAEIAGLAAVVARNDGRLSFVSDAARRLLGRQGRAPQSWNDSILSIADAGALAALCRRVRQGGQDETQVVTVPGDGRRLEARLHALAGGKNEVLVLFADITQQIRLNADLLRLRADNQAWAAELQHRVRNVLHVLSAMMYLEGAPGGGDDAAFDLVRGRILAMAQAHDTLEVRDGIAMVDLVACIRSLHALVCSGLGLEPNVLSLRLELDDVPLAPSIDVAVPIALIVYEVFSAAAKAAADGVECEIDVSIRRLNERVRLSISGLCIARDCLNLRLVEALARQLRAQFASDLCGRMTLDFSP
ncbi:HWE histidine kinase domain-containing protein [Magnetospirillum sulfuroxidans]|uniref:histidine kinase n=1 Tax=Magnetospirillum sulfuroxidans TaxID=611300 RepID=A0ABS5IED8_9PROT|nr:HWE histidine kinase domain-containing protein [Magnetospirillum sulfuroxidans]MBR9972078.1 hypothetical protein [Magnetospirillum sulfuroxidans]